MQKTGSSSPLEELHSAQNVLYDAIAAEDLSLAVASLPLFEVALRRALDTAESGRELWLDTDRYLQSCLCIARLHRQAARDEYSRLFDANSFRTEDRAVGTWGLSG